MRLYFWNKKEVLPKGRLFYSEYDFDRQYEPNYLDICKDDIKSLAELSNLNNKYDKTLYFQRTRKEVKHPDLPTMNDNLFRLAIYTINNDYDISLILKVQANGREIIYLPYIPPTKERLRMMLYQQRKCEIVKITSENIYCILTADNGYFHYSKGYLQENGSCTIDFTKALQFQSVEETLEHIDKMFEAKTKYNKNVSTPYQIVQL